MATKLVPVEPPPILDLDTLAPNAYLKVDGQRYDLLRSDQLGLIAFQRIQRLCPRFDELMVPKELTEDEEQELEAVLDGILTLVLKAPPEIRTRLNGFQRLQVVLSFIKISPRVPGRTTRLTTPPPAPPVPAVAPSTGAKRSRGSAASTPAPRRRRG